MASSRPMMVDIGTHSLALYTHGSQPSSPEDPVVMFVSGVASSSLVWSAVVRQLPSPLRSYTYDRSGFRNSEESPLAPTAENIALELSVLIERAAISHPLIIVGHSWAGVLLSEFIARESNARRVAGLVLVDANHETQPLIFNVNDPALQALGEGIDHYSGKGIEAEHKLNKEEWDAFRRDESGEKYEAIANKEHSEYAPSFETLRKKGLSQRQPLLGNKPVYIIGGKRSRDWGGMYKAGVARGNGTDEQRRHVQEMIRTADEKSAALMDRFRELSITAQVVIAQASGHFVQLTEPHLVVEGVEWVLEKSKATLSNP